MKKLLNVIHFGIIGTGIGFFMTAMSVFFMGGEGCTVKEMLIWATASFLCGVVTTIMFTDKFKLAVSTLIHFVCVFGVVLGANIACGYSNGIAELLKSILPAFLIIYIVVYLLVFLSSKVNAKQINNALGEKNTK